jgi:hypothetical protein
MPRLHYGCRVENIVRISTGHLCKTSGISYSSRMSIENIVSQIDAELARLIEARALLASAGRIDLKKVVPAKATAKAAAKTAKKKRILSPEARKRIADAQRKRWAAQESKSK